jgi:di/tricarboxylate transporter
LFFSWGYAFSGLVTLLCGIVALKEWDKLDTMHWPVIMIIVGGLGGGIGGLLTVLGGILGIASET